jgi:hypothetical protein
MDILAKGMSILDLDARGRSWTESAPDLNRKIGKDGKG